MKSIFTRFNTQGGVIAESAEVKIPLKEFRSFNFDRNDLHLAGEPGTGRVQVRVEVQYRLFLHRRPYANPAWQFPNFVGIDQ
jgi:hypothetical protein